jgi:adenylate cyclase class 2
MSQQDPKIETEIKLRLPDAATGQQLLAQAGFAVSVPRTFEQNVLYDTEDSSLRKRGVVLRLRKTGENATLTVKGSALPGKYKSREESEVSVSDFAASEMILSQLGYRMVFRYEKYRTEFTSTNSSGTVTLDETPIGVFFELEGAPEWIDDTARTLGFEEPDYLIESYGKLYLNYCQEHTLKPQNMTFLDR